MPNIRLIIEYNGEKFHGWQFQPGQRTIQEELHKTVEMVLRQKIRHVQASGRTDVGVHARAQVVNFFVDEIPDPVRLRRSISSILKGELSVHDVSVMADDFDSRKSAVGKTYRYTIYNTDVPPVLDHGRVWLVHDTLDIDRMKREAAGLIGRQDFKSFQGAGCEAPDTVKTIYQSEVSHAHPYIYYTVTGSGFLKHMVRNIVGTLVAFGRNDSKTVDMAELLSKKDREFAGPTAPSWGLCLEKVYYGKLPEYGT